MGTDTKAAQAVMSRIGQELRAAREKKPLTIDQVQKQTRIHSAVIKALEDGRLDEMLTPTYVRSFLRKYAEHLGLDGRQFLSEYANLRRADQSSLGVVMSRMKPSSRLRFRALFAGAIRAAVIVIAIWLAVVIVGKSAGIVKRWAGARREAGKVAASEDRAILKKKAQKAQSQVSASAIAQKAQPEAKERAPQKTAPQAQAAPAPIAKSAPLKLSIMISRPVRVKVTADGVLLFDTVLERGTVKTITADKVFNIYVAKGEAVEFVLNRTSLGSPGRGPIKNIEITRNGLRVK